jgi:hypothetical protein
MNWFRKSAPVVLQAPAPDPFHIHPISVHLTCANKNEWHDGGSVRFRDSRGNEVTLQLTHEDFAKIPIGSVFHLQFDGNFSPDAPMSNSQPPIGA